MKPNCLQRFRHFPVSINIEPTNKCNLNCSMCPRSESKKPIGLMDMELFRNIADEITKHDNVSVNLHKDGEPLLHPDLAEMIRYIKGKEHPFGNIKVGFNTNGILLTKQKAKELIDSGLDSISISMNAADRGTYMKITGVDAFDLVEKNAREFIRMSGRVKTFVTIIRMDKTEHEIGSFKSRWKNRAKVDFFTSWKGSKSDSLMPCSSERYPCPMLWSSLAVNWDGTVNPCCQDWNSSIVLGDLNVSTIQEIWNGNMMKKLRADHMNGTYAQCEKCNFWPRHKNIFFRVGKQWI